MNFKDFCINKDIFSNSCEECIYKDISNIKKCEKQFNLDNSIFITKFEFKCMIYELEEFLNDLNQVVNFICEQLY